MKKKMAAFFKKPHAKLVVIVTALIIIIPLGVSLSRYIMRVVRDSYLESKNFYFNSNRLKKDNPTYQINNWTGVGDFTIDITVTSKKNNQLAADFDIAYNTSYVCPSDVICTISKSSGVIYAATNTDSFILTVTPTRAFDDGVTVSVKISSTSSSPYVETISAVFDIVVGKRGISYTIDDEAASPYLLVSITNALASYRILEAFDSYSVGDEIDATVYKALSDVNKAKCVSAYITLEFDPEIVVLDTTSPYLKGAITETKVISGVDYVNKIKFKMDATMSAEVRFYKIDSTQDYSYPFVNLTSIIDFDAS